MSNSRNFTEQDGSTLMIKIEHKYSFVFCLTIYDFFIHDEEFALQFNMWIFMYLLYMN